MPFRRCRIFWPSKVICSTATHAPSLAPAQPVKAQPCFSQLQASIDRLEALVSILRPAPDTDSKVQGAPACKPRPLRPVGTQATSLSLKCWRCAMQLELLRRHEAVQAFSRSSR